jgi:ABC-type dipeptide/oligopeptide/nickel transport system permease component
MLHYILRRILTMIPTLLIISMLVFVIRAILPSCKARANRSTSRKSSFYGNSMGSTSPWYNSTGIG